MRRKFCSFALLFSIALLRPVLAGESWHVTAGEGVLLFCGAQPSHDGLVETLRLGYDLDAPVSFELGGLTGHFDSRADNDAPVIYSSWGDAIFHLARWERLDPFLTAGAGAFWSNDRALPENRENGLTPRLGAGFLYTLSEHWSLRVDATVMTLHRPDRQAGFGLLEAGLSYYFGDSTPASP